MRRLILFACSTASIVAASATAFAQYPPGPPPPPPPYYAPPTELPPAYVVEPTPARPSFEVTPMIGYQMGGGVDTYDGTVGVASGPTYGAAADIRIIGGTALELAYRLHDTEIDFSPYYEGNTFRLYGLTTHYFEAGVNQEIFVSNAVRPFAGVSVGGALFAPRADNISNDFRLLGALYGGVKIFITPQIAIRAQAKVSSIFLSSSSAVFCSSYAGCSYGLGGAGIGQLEIAVGPTIAF